VGPGTHPTGCSARAPPGPGLRACQGPRVSQRALGPLVVVVAALLALLAVVSTAPAVLGLSTVPVLAHAVALRGLSAVVLVALALLAAGAAAVLGRRAARAPGDGVPGGGRLPAWGAPAVLAVVATGCAAVHLGVLVGRGVDPGGPAPAPGGATGEGLVVMTLNAQVDGVTGEEVADAVVTTRADVVAMPETSAALAQDVVDAVAARTGQVYEAFTTQADDRAIAATSLLVAPRLGAHETVPGPALELGAVVVGPVEGDGPVLAAVHPPPPIPPPFGPFPMDRWAEQAAVAADVCRTTPGAVVAGDYNATLDHAPLRELAPCVSAAAEAGAGGVGTWPTSLPPVLGGVIDHVLVDARVWDPVAASVLTVGATDHRAVVVHLVPR